MDSLKHMHASPQGGSHSGVASGGDGANTASVKVESGSAAGLPLDGVSGKWSDVYAAETFGEGVRAVFRVVPYWVPVVGIASSVGVFYVVFRVRLFLSQWRIAERQRAERKFDLLENLRGVSIGGPVGAVETLADDGDPEDDDDDEEDEDDETAVSMYDVDEFRSSLGIRLPRDEDLLQLVEKMLMADPIPDGWVLYRTTAGIIRFMNLNTQELFFFHPGKRKEKTYIDEELKRRNRLAMESKYSFSYEDEGMNSLSMATRSNNARAMGNPGPSPIDFGGDSVPDEEDETQNSTFKRMFGYFLEKEQKKIEQDVARSRSTTTSRTGGGAGGGGGGGGSSGNTPRGTATGAATSGSPAQRMSGGGGMGGMEGGGVGRRQPVASSTYRVVASSAIHGSRGGSVKN